MSQGSHPVPTARVIKDAQDRLRAIKRDDIDELMSFRISGKRRIWCIRNASTIAGSVDGSIRTRIVDPAANTGPGTSAYLND